MSDWSLGALPVVGGRLTLPTRGAWLADVEAVSDEDVDGVVTLTVGETSLVGRVLRGGVFEGRWRGRVVGGAGGLGRTVTARQYRSVTRRAIVAATLAEVGETLAPDAAGLDDVLVTWARFAEPASRCLARLVAAWRVDVDGAITTSPWPASTLPALEGLDASPADRVLRAAVEGIAVWPGMVDGARAVASVVYTLDGAAMRAEVAFGD